MDVSSEVLTCSNPRLDAEITYLEIKWSLKKCKDGKSPGPDGIPYEFLKNLLDVCIGYLVSLFNKILEKEDIPITWGDTFLRMIYKKEDKTDPANYRPIALMNCISKVFTQILAERFGGWLEESDLLPEWQAGFRKNRSCLDNIFSLNALIQSRLSLDKGKLFVLFVDFRGAFPSVTHDLLWEKLYTMGTGSKLINILKNLYDKANVAM